MPSSSLRLEGLAQARMTLAQGSSPPPRRELDKEYSGPYAISLRRDPFRLSETSARSKHVLVVWVTTRAESPRRTSAHLAWARQARLGETISVHHYSHLHNAYTHTQQRFQPVRTLIIVHNLKESTNHNDTSQITPHEEVLASLTWNELVLSVSTRNSRVPKL